MKKRFQYQALIIILTVIVVSLTIVTSTAKILDIGPTGQVVFTRFLEDGRTLRSNTQTMVLPFTEPGQALNEEMHIGDKGLFTVYGIDRSVTLNQIRGGNQVLLSIDVHPTGFLGRTEYIITRNVPEFIDFGLGTDAADFRIDLHENFGPDRDGINISFTILGPIEDPQKPAAEIIEPEPIVEEPIEIPEPEEPEPDEEPIQLEEETDQTPIEVSMSGFSAQTWLLLLIITNLITGSLVYYQMTPHIRKV